MHSMQKRLLCVDKKLLNFKRDGSKLAIEIFRCEAFAEIIDRTDDDGNLFVQRLMDSVGEKTFTSKFFQKWNSCIATAPTAPKKASLCNPIPTNPNSKGIFSKASVFEKVKKEHWYSRQATQPQHAKQV